MTMPAIDLFDEGEAISENLHFLEGLENALVNILDPLLSGNPDVEQQTLALIASMRHFRLSAAQAAGRITSAGFTHNPSERPSVNH